MPKGKLLALVRMDGNDTEILGSEGRLRTKICWASPPYTIFDCPSQFDGQRLDGPLSFFHDGRLFVVARKHLGKDVKKRTALFEITGDFDGGALAIKEWESSERRGHLVCRGSDGRRRSHPRHLVLGRPGPRRGLDLRDIQRHQYLAGNDRFYQAEVMTTRRPGAP